MTNKRRRRDIEGINPRIRTCRESLVEGGAELSSLALRVETLEYHLEFLSNAHEWKEGSVRSEIQRPRIDTELHWIRRSC